jgi:hypothetical protein
MNKKIVIILLTFLLVIFNTTVIKASEPNDSYTGHELSEIKNYENTDIALSINNQIASLQGSELDYLLDNYAGVYLNESNDIVLGIKPSGKLSFENLTATYNEHLENAGIKPDSYKVEEKKFSLIELKAMREYLFKNSDLSIASISIVQSDNKIKVIVNDSLTFSKLFTFLDSTFREYASDMIEVSVKGERQLLSYVYSSEKIKYRKKILFIWFDQWHGTVGFNATRNGLNGVVTNSHVAPYDYSMFTNSNVFIGKANISIFGGTVDAAFVPFSDQNAWGVSNEIHQVGQTSGTYYIKWLSYVVEGSRVKSHGVTTNYQYGLVLSVDTAEIISGQYFYDLIETSIVLQGGDSGGPLVRYYVKSSNYGLVGINFAGDGTTSLTIKIDNVVSQLGVSVVFN